MRTLEDVIEAAHEEADRIVAAFPYEDSPPHIEEHSTVEGALRAFQHIMDSIKA